MTITIHKTWNDVIYQESALEYVRPVTKDGIPKETKMSIFSQVFHQTVMSRGLDFVRSNEQSKNKLTRLV